jgi:hypothetical protein
MYTPRDYLEICVAFGTVYNSKAFCVISTLSLSETWCTCTGPSCFYAIVAVDTPYEGGGGCQHACFYALLLACANQRQNGISLSTPPHPLFACFLYVSLTLWERVRGKMPTKLRHDIPMRGGEGAEYTVIPEV